MERKTYIQPQTTAIILKMHAPLLTISRLESTDDEFELVEKMEEEEEDR